MTGFFKSFAPLLKKSKKYLLEIILLTVALAITITALAIYAKNNQSSEEEIETFSTRLRQDYGGQAKIFVDVSGAVNRPNVYKISFGARIKEIIDKAGGLSEDADKMFFNRNFNLARIITDQEKIYVPSTVEINNGIFVQNQRTLDYTSPIILPNTGIVNNATTENTNQLININSATIEELDQLPGIGQVTANKIITSRPYSALEELLIKKVVNKNVFEKIKNLISI